MIKINKKNKLLLFGFFIVLYICYVFAFSNTIEYYTKYNVQKELAATDFNSPTLLGQLTSKEKQLDIALEQYTKPESTSFQNELLKQLSILSNTNNLKIIDFKEPHIFIEKDIKVTSYAFSIEGTFNGVLLLINGIENDPSLGFVKHLSFQKKMNYKTNSNYLVTKVILAKNETIKNN